MTGFEPLIGAATAGLTSLIGKVMAEKGSGLLKKADIDLVSQSFQRLMFYALSVHRINSLRQCDK
ncbi:MAG: hypothetical protein O3A14_07825 [Cyanobacteria bacterium]|nr:hypothetical protein [Cyanobacteriota bacterium]